MINTRIQVLCAWTGPALIVIFLIAMIPLAHMIPPLSPTMTGAQVAAFFDQHRIQIRLGMLLMMLGAGVGMVWPAAIADQMRRIERNSRVLTYTQLVSGVLSNFLFLPCALFWGIAAFRSERSPEVIQLLDDFGWFFLLMAVSPAVIQSLALALAILSDKSASPLFPRWLGYFNIWAAALFLPGGVLLFFKTGPFAWNGLFPFWIPLTVFSLWLVLNTMFVLKAIRRPEN
jgi:hypothetical protein